MAFFNEFPHTRTYDSDLAWLIRRMKEVLAKMDRVDELLAEVERLVATLPEVIRNQILEELRELLSSADFRDIVASLIPLYGAQHIKYFSNDMLAPYVPNDTAVWVRSNCQKEMIATISNGQLFIKLFLYVTANISKTTYANQSYIVRGVPLNEILPQGFGIPKQTNYSNAEGGPYILNIFEKPLHFNDGLRAGSWATRYTNFIPIAVTGCAHNIGDVASAGIDTNKIDIQFQCAENTNGINDSNPYSVVFEGSCPIVLNENT